MMRCVIAGLSVLAGWAGLAAGQTVKVDFGTGAGTPAASHAAGGLEGFWNTVGAGGGTWMSLRLLGGETSGVVLRTSALEFDVDRWDVDDGSVMADYLAARHSDATLEFAGLEAGWYRVLTYSGYSGTPSHPTRVWINGNEGGAQEISGPYTGTFAVGVTHSEHLVRVLEDGELLINIYTWGDAVVNGVQLVQVPGAGTGAALVLGGLLVRRRRR